LAVTSRLMDEYTKIASFISLFYYGCCTIKSQKLLNVHPISYKMYIVGKILWTCHFRGANSKNGGKLQV
jgi:hypothetical protein